MRDYETYRAVYCGLCHTLGKRYTFLSRFFLNYDLTFFATLLLALKGKAACVNRRRCPAHPFRRLPACQETPELLFAADCGVLLLYSKLLDDLHDAGLSKRAAAALLLPFGYSMKRRAAARQPAEAARIASAMRAQAEAEKAGAGIDAAAEPMASLMRDLLLSGADGLADPRVLARFGYFLGRWVYLIDAADDLEKDVADGDYNPFTLAWKIGPDADFHAARNRALSLLNSCVYEMQAALALLPLKQYVPILENTVSLGLPHMQQAVAEAVPAKAR